MCTSFLFRDPSPSSTTTSSSSTAITGRSLDYSSPLPYKTVQYASGRKYTALHNPNVTWTGTQGVCVVVSEDDVDVPFEGMNSAGLSISGNLANADYPWSLSGQKISSDDVVLYILSQSATLEDAKALFSKTNVKSKWNYHYIMYDSTGASFVIEYQNKLPVISNDVAPILTNNPDIGSQNESLNNYAHLQNWSPSAILPDSGNQFHGQGMLGMPGDWMSSSRYVRAYYFLKFTTADTSVVEDQDLSLSLAKSLLNSVSLSKGVDLGSDDDGNPIYTQIQILKDLKNSVLYTRVFPAFDWTVKTIKWT